MSLLGLSVLATATGKWLGGPPGGFSWFKLWVTVLMGTAFVALIYRNLFVRDELLLYRKEPEEGTHEDEDRLVLHAGGVRAVRVCPVPGPYSAEGKNAAIGIGRGLIEIETTEGCYRFGAGLDAVSSEVMAGRIAAYCGLHAVGPQWKALPEA